MIRGNAGKQNSWADYGHSWEPRIYSTKSIQTPSHQALFGESNTIPIEDMVWKCEIDFNIPRRAIPTNGQNLQSLAR